MHALDARDDIPGLGFKRFLATIAIFDHQLPLLHESLGDWQLFMIA